MINIILATICLVLFSSPIFGATAGATAIFNITVLETVSLTSGGQNSSSFAPLQLTNDGSGTSGSTSLPYSLTSNTTAKVSVSVSDLQGPTNLINHVALQIIPTGGTTTIIPDGSFAGGMLLNTIGTNTPMVHTTEAGEADFNTQLNLNIPKGDSTSGTVTGTLSFTATTE